jgi:hypothetical protein
MKKSLLTHLFCVIITVLCVRCSGSPITESVQKSETTNPDTNLDGDPSTGGSSTTVGNPAGDPSNNYFLKIEIPRSLQIFFAKKSLISLCLGMLEVLLNSGL